MSSVYVGKIGERIELTVTVVSVHQTELSGVDRVWMKDEHGNHIEWWTTAQYTASLLDEKNKPIKIRVTVDEHHDDITRKVTFVKRLKIV